MTISSADNNKTGKYGGTPTKMMELAVGTKFYECNGGWSGEIVLKDNQKHVLIDGDSMENAKIINEDHLLDIEVE
ncbi:hypothetical protein [Evansella clarkii]|uniref:hypothetical protein n=1 Tax=Evansella clarkii TaxID=79879 RepID=UPI0009980965|nr:hypothetical protein [Evansella clarkii]